MSDETLKHSPDTQIILRAIAELSKKVDDNKKESDGQFESIRQGLVDNDVRLNRIEVKLLLLTAEVTVLAEEVRHNRTVLV